VLLVLPCQLNPMRALHAVEVAAIDHNGAARSKRLRARCLARFAIAQHVLADDLPADLPEFLG
jgi:hypothetical protein